jgi:hypothetical protein
MFIIGQIQVIMALAPSLSKSFSRYSNLLLEESIMKKFFTMFLAVAFALSLVGVAVAADNAVKPMNAAEKSATSAEKSATSAEKSAASAEKSATAAKKSAKAATSQLITGTVEAVDAAAGTFTVKGKKGNVDLKAGEKVKLGDVKIGDKVVVKYADGTASSLKAVKAAKAAAKSAAEAKKAVPAAAPVAAPAPAPAAAPVKK